MSLVWSSKCRAIMPECCKLVCQGATPCAFTKPSNLRKKSHFAIPRGRCLGHSGTGLITKGSYYVELLSLQVYIPPNWPKYRSVSGPRAAKLLGLQAYCRPEMKMMLCACPRRVPRVPKASPLSKQANLLFSTIGGVCDVFLPSVVSSAASVYSRKTRIPPVVRTEAQGALFEYLHGTRSLQFADAEHMSKYSPTFLESLISKLEGDEDIGRSLSRFLRYHPINEFEPFLESLGLKRSEIYSLLPRNFFFLSDDYIMLENFHVLCNYGVPRGRIGKIYKEARDIFSYGHGVLSSKLSAYEALGLSVPTVIKLVACCPSLLIGGVHWDFLQVLEKLKDSGIEHDWIRVCLSEEGTYHWGRMLKMLEFLDETGCNEKDLERLIRGHPKFLFVDSGKKIYILVAMLLKVGIRMTDVLSLFFQYPHILDGNYVKNLWHSMHFLFRIGMRSGDIASILCTNPQVLGSFLLKNPEIILSNLDIDCETLCDMIKRDPHQLGNLASRKKTGLMSVVGGNHVREKTTFLLKLGFVENSDEMTVAQKKFRGRGDQLQERFDCLVGAGFDCHDVASMVKAVPPMLNQGTDVLKEKIDYLLLDLGYPMESIVTFPTCLCYNIERIKLRLSMYNWLKEKGAVKQILSLSTVLACSNARFLKYFVYLHSEGPGEWERLKRCISSS